ncbi:A/G-specific adenine glycosylase [Marivirga sp. S37H4]|uniref:Adenine DNA glycosylase n=1 Tax=Marivirga aurantiaca TaxID=2802615 RepID=A0A934X050_9BACT|nr:A/G-specific adenine glycosylase [Marivirga aurantiaca]MBK6265995.1 A/G-specific adenine glycosylase [Marivirga aurantiaca]
MVDDFSSKLVFWYQKHLRELPWRNTPDPYKIWLSEIILQQTRVAQGMPYYKRFIEKYPTVEDLALASEEEVLRLWQGLGYYSRARNLHACAKAVVEKFNGKFPEDYETLQSLKGIGKYTAAAIASFAFKKPIPVVDGNVFRVLSRYFLINANIADAKNFKIFFETASSLIPQDEPDLFNQAMMDLGATICSPTNPACLMCPIAVGCEAREQGLQKQFPVKEKKIKVSHRFFYYWVWGESGKIAMKKRGPQDIWQGLFDFDLTEKKEKMEEGQIREVLATIAPNADVTCISTPIKHILTHQRIEAVFIEINGVDKGYVKEKDLKLFDLSEIESLPKPILVDKYLNGRIN